MNLFTTQRRTVLFAGLKVTALYECSVRCTICRSLVLSSLTYNQFELQRSLIRINEHLPWSSELQARGIWRRSSELLSSESLALGLQSLQVFGRWRRSLELLSSESSALDQNHILQRLGLVHQNFLSQSLQNGFLANLQNLRTPTIFWSETRLQKRFEWCFACAFNFWWSEFCLRVRICSKTQSTC